MKDAFLRCFLYFKPSKLPEQLLFLMLNKAVLSLGKAIKKACNPKVQAFVRPGRGAARSSADGFRP